MVGSVAKYMNDISFSTHIAVSSPSNLTKSGVRRKKFFGWPHTVSLHALVLSAMTSISKVVLFGDQTVDPCPLIKQLCRESAHSVTLRVFLQRAYSAIRQEVALSELSDRSRFPSFDSVLALAENYSQRNEPNEAVSTVLLCIAQLGLLLS